LNFKAKNLKAKIKCQGRKIKGTKTSLFYCPINGGSSNFIASYLHLFIIRIGKKDNFLLKGEQVCAAIFDQRFLV